ncbi:hypothetical protein [Cytobacillus firmus]|uniref:Uncharacterized protein n=1 Tax=Cytobacillus firmus TaxID=1399 RepID=A0AA46PMX4_CYTFI|nr:hypothetical protein [Cytobacillus firmus]KML44178.1 hypothetical protein VL14_05110 [Cytobacillus firmus]UYG93282.1 hypothetical protein OD459_13500 [Cytobacillus firmus]
MPESEPGPTSDTESRKRSIRVRTPANFGHRKEKRASQSQNPGQLRTQKGEKSQLESELGSTSDTERRKEPVRVGTRSNFGHRKQKLRTQKGEKSRPESEPGPTSDTERRKEQARVRTLANFGHRKEKRASQSQNPGQLRTEKGEKSRPESEPGSTSDTESRKRSIRVGTRVNFGHRKEKRAS